MSEDYVDIEEVRRRLDEEAARMDAAEGGVHKFNNIRRHDNATGANWTANYGVRGGGVSLEDAVMLIDMRETLVRVQAEMPLIKFAK